MTFGLTAKAAGAGVLAATTLLLAPAGAARAQDVVTSAGSAFSLGSLDEYLRSGRNRDLNPTGFGKPGEYWSVPTGSRIARGPRAKPAAKAEVSASTDAPRGADATPAPRATSPAEPGPQAR